MKKEERIKEFIDTFPEVYDALILYAEREGYVGIRRWINEEVEQIIDYVISRST